jgi:hypothetical protein
VVFPTAEHPDGRIDPALTLYGPTGIKLVEIWYQNDKAHRLDGPADIRYFPNGKIIEQAWYELGRIHRLHGPAIIKYCILDWNIEFTHYYLHGNSYSREDYEAELLKLAQQQV